MVNVRDAMADPQSPPPGRGRGESGLLNRRLPNRLTVARLAGAVLFVLAMSVPVPGGPWIAAAVFLLAAVTDFLDGHLARRHGWVSDFGKLMDPLADKVLMAAGFVCLVPSGLVPAWAAVAILAREFLVTGLRTLAAGKGIVLAAERLGKWKTVLQVVTVLYLLGLLAMRPDDPASLPGHAAGMVLLLATVLLTFGSGLSYLANNRGLLAGQT